MVVKDVFLPWYNAYRFLVQNVLRWELETGKKFDPAAVRLDTATNVLDKWICAASRSLTNYVRKVGKRMGVRAGRVGRGRRAQVIVVLGVMLRTFGSSSFVPLCTHMPRAWG